MPADHSLPLQGQNLLAASATAAISIGLLLALPVIVALEQVPEAATLTVGEGAWWILLAGLSAQAVTVAVAHRHPAMAVLITSGIPLVVVWTSAGLAFGVTSVAVLVTVYRAAVRHPITRVRLPLGAGALLLAGAHAVNEHATTSDPGLIIATALVQAGSIILGPLLVALVMSSRRQTRQAQQRESLARAREHEARMHATLAAQRTAMARELHDIAAHHLSGIALMAAGLDRQIDTDPEAAKAAVGQMRDQTSVILDDLRRLVGLLREGTHDGEDDDQEPRVETLAGVADLVEARSAGGSPPQLRIQQAAATSSPLGEGLGPAAQLTAYRMVQEALANAVHHAPGAQQVVEIDERDASAVLITVSNAPAEYLTTSDGGGFGLRGMHERAELIGAELKYGPTIDGGWQVRLRLPRAVKETT